MPIQGLTDKRRVPRLGIIRLGIKAKSEKGTEYPKAVDYFVLPPEHPELAALGEKPTCLPIMFPIEDETVFAQQFYRCYSMTRGLVCKGDGEKCGRLVDKETGALADRKAKEVVLMEMDCAGRECPDYQSKRCKEVMNLQFLMPTIPGLGVWQINTGSVNSIININSSVEFIRKMYGRISFIPLMLALEKQTVITPEDGTENGGKKKTVHVLTLNTKGTMQELMASASKTTSFLLPAPATSEPPEDAEDEDGTYPPDAIQKKDSEHEALEKEIFGEDRPAENVKPESPAYVKATENPPELPKEMEKAKAAKPKREMAKVDPTTIKTVGDLFNVCKSQWNILPEFVIQDLQRLNPDKVIKSRLDITDPKAAYQQLAEARASK